MSVLAQVVEQKWFDQHNNDLSFGSNLTTFRNSFASNVDAKVKVSMKVNLFTKIELRDYYLKSDSIAGNNLFAKDINVGDVCRLVFAGDDTHSFGFTVTSVSDNVIYYDNVFGTPYGGSYDVYLGGADYLYITTPTPYLRYSFGLTPNNEEPDYTSSLDSETQTYFSALIDMTGVATDTMKTTRKNYKTGSATVKFIALVQSPYGDSGAFTVGQQFQITHEFIVQNYNEEQLEYILDGIKPPEYVGANTLDYCVKFQFYVDYINAPNNVKTYEHKFKGSVGWYNENFNKSYSLFTLNNPPVEITDVATSSLVTNISNRRATHVNCVITQDEAPQLMANDMEIILYIKTLVPASKYENVNSDFNDIFFYSQVRLIAHDTVVTDGFFTNAKYNIIGTSPIAGALRLNFTVDFGSSAYAIDNESYVLGVQIGSKSLLYEDASNVTLSISQYDSNFDTSDLITVNSFEHFTSPNTDLIEDDSEGFTNANLHAEEKVYSRLDFDIPDLGTVKILSISRKLMCIHDTDSSKDFEIEIENIPLNSFIYFGDTSKVVDYEWENGFVNQNVFNENKSYISKKLDIGWKVPHQSWLELKNVDPSFFDDSKSFNGLNKLASNYSDTANPFVVKLVVEFLLDDSYIAGEGHTTTHEVRSEELNIYGYDENENGTTDYVAVTTTYDEFGVSIAGDLLNDSITEVRGTFTPPSPPSFSTVVDFDLVAGTWQRMAHGNKFYQNAGVYPPVGINTRGGDWINNQIDSNDTMEVPDGGGGIDSYVISDSLFTSTSSSITVVANLDAWLGVLSDVSYESYSITGKMYSANNDDDCIGFIIASHTDSFGVENTLSLIATTGGVGLEKNPAYTNGSTTINIFDSRRVGNKLNPRWAIVYNFGKDDGHVVKDSLGNNLEVVFPGGYTGFNWSDLADFNFQVIRTSDDIVCNCSWTIGGLTVNDPISFSLLDSIDTFKFRNAKKIGFATMSQNSGGFKDVVIVNPNSDFYGIVRIEPRNATTNKQIREYSTLEGEASLGWNDESLILNALVNTDELFSDDNDITIHIAPIENKKKEVTISDLASSTTVITFKGTINGLIVKYTEIGTSQYIITKVLDGSIIAVSSSSYNVGTGVMSLTIPAQTLGTQMTIRIIDDVYFSYIYSTTTS